MASPLEKKLRTWKRRRSDEKLFRELVAAHELNARQRRLLTALADRYRLTRLSEIFVRPSLMTVSPDRSIWSNAEVQKLRSKLAPARPAVAVPNAALTKSATPSASGKAAAEPERTVSTAVASPVASLAPSETAAIPAVAGPSSPSQTGATDPPPGPATGTPQPGAGASPTHDARPPRFGLADAVASPTDPATSEIAPDAGPDERDRSRPSAAARDAASPPDISTADLIARLARTEPDAEEDAEREPPRAAAPVLLRDTFDDPDVEGIVPVSRE